MPFDPFANCPDADLLDKIREIIEELKITPGPRASDIERLSRRH